MSKSRIIRHRLQDRLFHWITALSVLVLLATGLLPVLGVEFGWVTLHWIAGVILTIAVLYHTGRVLYKRRFTLMRIRRRDISAALDRLRHGPGAVEKPGKYTLAQKAMHHAMMDFSLLAIVTGLLMMVRIDTPFWERDPYLFSAENWGIIYVLHGASALFFVSLVLLHIYFALRPEKLFYARSMIRGWITPDELTAYHDPALWPGEGDASPGDGRHD